MPAYYQGHSRVVPSGGSGASRRSVASVDMFSRSLPPPSGDRVAPAVVALRPVGLVVGVLVLLSAATYTVRDPLYLTLAGAAGSSSLWGPVAGLVAEKGLLVLVAVTAWLVIRSWRRDRCVFWTLAAAGAGVVGAYVTSEAVKMLVAEERPCRALVVRTVLACPPPGDWSWPSNHAVIAAAFATACVVAAPRTAWFVVPVAVSIAAGRVLAGVHYVHDVAAGLALGVLGVVLVVLVARRCTTLVHKKRA